MDLNIASINTSADTSNFLMQPIESQDDFSKIIENQVRSVTLNTDESNPEISDSSSICIEEGLKTLIPDAEKNFNDNGKPLPPNSNKKRSFDADREVNDSIICILNPMVQSLASKPILGFVPPNLNLTNTLEDAQNAQANHESLDGTDKVNTMEGEHLGADENNTAMLIENPPLDLNLKKIALKDEINLPISNNPLTLTKLNIEKSIALEQDGFIPAKVDERHEEEASISTIQNLLVSSESKVKIKNPIQTVSVEASSDNVDLGNLESSYGSFEIKETETSVIEYDTNNALNFEKELGERLVNMIKENDHDVTLKLDPPELGKMDINLQILENEAHLSFYTSNLQVKSAIESSLNELRNLFGQQSLSLGDVNVYHHGSEGGRNPQSEVYESREIERLGGLSNIRPPKTASEGKISVFV